MRKINFVYTLMFISLAFFANAADKNKTEKYQVIDMNQFKNADVDSKQNSNIKFSTGCKSKSGVEYKANEAGYRTCMAEVELDKAANRKDGSAPSVGFTIGN